MPWRHHICNKICLKNNWKIINTKLKHKSYSMSVNEYTVIDKILNKLHDQKKTYWIQNSALYTCLIFIAWWTVYKDEKLIWKEQAVINLKELNHVTVSDAYFLFLQSDIIVSILECKYISIINDIDFFYQWWVAVKNHEKFIIINYQKFF